MTIYTRLQIRRGDAAEWIEANPVLADGEQALENDTLKTKFGDGVTNYVDLPYQDQQGPIGPTGPIGSTGSIGPKGETGSFGGAIFHYSYLTDTVDSDPGSGNLKFDNALTTATQLFIDFEDADAVDNQNYLNAIDDSTSLIKGHFKIEVVGSPEDYVYYAINGEHYHHASYFEVPVEYLSGSVTTIPDDTPVTITFVRTGDKGDQGDLGPTGPGSTISIGDVTASDPGGDASVTNSGTEFAAVLDFVIPRGATGPQGPTGPSLIDWQGEWSASTTYPENSIVYYGGKTYISVGISYPPEGIGATPASISTWSVFSSNGDTGPQGGQGIQGNQGPSGVISVTGPITNTGTSTSAVIGISQSSLTIAESQVTNLVSDLNLKAPKASPSFTGSTSIANLAMGSGLSISGTDYVSGSPYTSSIGFGGGTLYANGNKLATYLDALNYPVNYTANNTKTLELSDINKLVIMNDAAMNYVYVPLNSSVAFPLGSQITLTSYGTGRISVVVINGVTINATPGLLTRTRYSTATLVKTGTDTWLLYGDLTA